MYRESFFNYLEFEKRYSQHTIDAYQTDLRQFHQYLSEQYELKELSDASFQMVRSWVVSLLEQKIAPRSVNRKISSLKTFYKYLKREGVLQENPMSKVSSPKVAKRLPVFVEEERMEFLLDEVEFPEGYVGERDKSLLELFYATGMRVSELVNIKVRDIDFHTNSLKVLGKRNKERIIPFSPELSKLLQEYLVARDGKFGQSEAQFLLLRESGEKMDRGLVYRIVNSYLGVITTANKKSPHVLRHTFATHMLNNGADLNSIKEILGHANLSATQVYTHNTIEKLKRIHNHAHPRGKK